MKKLIILSLLFVTQSMFADWEQCKGPYGGNIQSLVSNGISLFAGSSNAGIFRSTNNGENWTVANIGLTNLRINTLAAKGDIVFAGTEGGGIFRSKDNGGSWAAVNTGLTDNYVYSIISSGTTLIAGTIRGVFFSTDNGDNWLIKKAPQMALQNVSSLATIGNTVFAGTGDDGNGIFRTTDNGDNWVSLNNAGFSTQCLAVKGTILFAGAYLSVYRSTDNGENWTKVITGLPKKSLILTLAVSDSGIFAGISNNGIFRSTDNGENWTEVNNGLYEKNIQALLVNGDVLFAGTSWITGVYRSRDNGGNWYASNSGLTKLSVCLAVINKTIFAGTYGGGVFQSSNNGESWTRSLVKHVDIESFVVMGNILFALSSGGLYKSIDNGNNWIQSYNGLIDEHGASDEHIIAAIANGSTIFTMGEHGNSFRSNDSGKTWSSFYNGKWSTPLLLRDTILYLRGQNGIWRTSINKYTHEFLNSFTSKDVTCLIQSGSTLFAGTSNNGIFRSTDNGGNWTETNIGLTNLHILSFMVSDTLIFARTADEGIYRSTDNGSTWIPKHTKLMTSRILSLAVSSNTIFAGTDGEGIFRANIDDFAVDVTENLTAVNMLQISPNPCDDYLKITGINSLSKNQNISIFNILGKIVKQEQINETTQLQLNISDLTPGVYYLRVGNETKMFVKK